MIIENFFAGFRPHLSRADLEAEIKRLAGDYHAAVRERDSYKLKDAMAIYQYSSELQDARNQVAYLHEKLEQVRPYLVAAAKGSSLQARGDLAALDAVLRSAKP